MKLYRYKCKALSSFVTPPKGDTLFGQICWALRERFGVAKLEELLQSYTDHKPFAVVSDFFPADHIPRPECPVSYLYNDDIDQSLRKLQRKKRWIPTICIEKPMNSWLDDTECTLSEVWETHRLTHNSINRQTGTTSTDGFAPFTVDVQWYNTAPKSLNLYVVLDNEKLSIDHMQQVLDDIGSFGFGKDASTGQGRFCIEESAEEFTPKVHPGANAWLTLAPCAPQNLGWINEQCFYMPFIRFGRHGNNAVHSGKPFKNPIIMAQTGALLTPKSSFSTTLYCGQGLGGKGLLSHAIPETVHQGYAPVLPVYVEEFK